jgi:hypothetical protein
MRNRDVLFLSCSPLGPASFLSRGYLASGGSGQLAFVLPSDLFSGRFWSFFAFIEQSQHSSESRNFINHLFANIHESPKSQLRFRKNSTAIRTRTRPEFTLTSGSYARRFSTATGDFTNNPVVSVMAIFQQLLGRQNEPSRPAALLLDRVGLLLVKNLQNLPVAKSHRVASMDSKFLSAVARWVNLRDQECNLRV